MGTATAASRCGKQPATNRRPLLATAAVFIPLPLWAALPTPVAPSTDPDAGDWIGLIQGYIKDGGLVLGLAIAVLGFLWIAYLGFAKFNEARQGKAEWAEVGVLGIVGAIVLIFASYLLTEAAGVI
ncbi:MAG: TIGR03745 family integrating conjugative element membrane protein [Gammaproteobacteria bacterium]|nr:TIGR03745 family integrating conjugative element membrane protein [Gammaproteobacteria bacterium]